jgi:radical SAM/Cys-rich protein
LASLDLKDAAERPAEFDRSVAEAGHDPFQPGPLEIFQINVGKLCNMTCRHCHVDAGPDRTDAMMDDKTVDAVLTAMERSGAHTVDITGGAPELHPRFAEIVDRATAAGIHVIDRCNLTILLVPKFRHLPQWLAERGVEVVASLPHCRKMNTDAQRGNGTFAKSIEALKRLNAAGYGQGDPRRILTLMSNPAGAFLGGSQATMEQEWRQCLEREHGVQFDRLFVLNNMPISRFLEWLLERDQLATYMQMLLDAFNPGAVDGLMCRNTISVSWDGRIYDCDFNQMLDLEARTKTGDVLHVKDFDPERYAGRTIRTDRHCFGCTAGAGSSCGGATV